MVRLAAARSTIANSGLLQEPQRFCSRDHSCSRPHALHSRRFRNIGAWNLNVVASAVLSGLPPAITMSALRTAHATARFASRDTFQHNEFANADGNSPGGAEWSGVFTRARAGGKCDAQAH